MLIYISMPLKGLSEEEIRYNHQKIVDALNLMFPSWTESRSECYDNYMDYSPLFCFSKSLTAISKADLIVFGEGWQNARGCIIEHKCCKDYGHTFIENIERLVK